MAEIHILYNKGNNTWYGKQSGAKRISFGGIPTQYEAIKQGKKKKKNQQAELVIHRKDNSQIRERNSYGKDPFPPRG